MSKCVQKKRLSADKIASIFEGLSRLMPSNRPSTREVLESQQAVILAAIARGNSLRDIVNFLTKKGLNVSHESLRKSVLLWQSGVASGVKPESKKAEDIQNVEVGVAVKNGTISRQVMGCSVSKSGAVKYEGTGQATVNKDHSSVSKDNQNREVNGSSDVSNLQARQSQMQAAKCVNHDDSVLSTDVQKGVSGKVKEAVFSEKKNLAFLNSDTQYFNNKDKIQKAAFDVEPDKEKY